MSTNALQRLKENDPTLTELDFNHLAQSRVFSSGSSALQDLLQALGENVHVQFVNLVFRVLHPLTKEEMTCLFRAVGSLPKLERIRVASSGLAGLPLQLINEALSNLHGGTFQSLTLCSVHFKDNVAHKTIHCMNTNDQEYRDFLEVLQSDKVANSLESFVLEDAEDTFDLDALVDALVKLPKLKGLTLRTYSTNTQRLSPRSLELLFASKTIQSLSLKRLQLVSILPEALIALEDNTTLSELSLEQNGMETKCGMALAYLLRTNTTLTTLSVGYNHISDECGDAIISALSSPTSILCSLDLTANDIGLQTCRRLAHLLVSSPNVETTTLPSSLQRLYLGQNFLYDEGVAMIAFSLGSNSTLRSLSLSETQITEATCSVLGASLCSNTSLEQLNLSNNRLNNDGANALAHALPQNTHLLSLNLSDSGIADKGIVDIAKALKKGQNQTLQSLNFAGNHIWSMETYQTWEQDVLSQDNYILQHLWLPPMPSVCATVSATLIPLAITSYIQLNRLGRIELMENLDNGPLWVNAIVKTASTNMDLLALYTLLRSNPNVVSWMR